MDENQIGTKTSNKRIAKNSLYLYIRSLVSIIVSLYTSRVFLNQLGIEDYGIYNLVGGVIYIFTVLVNLMAVSTQRFLSIEIGRNDQLQLNKILNISITLHIVAALLFLVVSEIGGLYIINHYLKIPEARLDVAIITFHVTILTAVANLFRVPYNALIIAHEKMSFYAYLSIWEVVAKLLITLSLSFFTYKLIAFSWQLFFITLLTTLVYFLYCKTKFGLPKYKVYSIKGNPEYRSILSFSGWSLFGNLFSVLRDQGLGFILNYFYGIILNAAMGIMSQISNVYSTLFLNLQAAFQPQIIQCSINDVQRYRRLVSLCCLYSSLLMGMVCIPMITSCKAILTLWLGIVPDYSVQFVQIVMVRILFSSFSQGIYITLNANAKIKTVQVVSSILSILTLVGAYILLRLKFEPYTVIVISAICEFCLLVYRLYYMNLTANISANGLVRYCSKAIIMITIFVFIAFYISAIVENMITSLLCMVITLALYITVTFFLLEDSQRSFIISKLKTTYNRLYKA